MASTRTGLTAHSPGPILGRYLRVLDVLADSREPLSATTISERSVLPISSTYRILSQLRGARLVAYVEASNSYWLGMKCLEYGGALLRGLSVRDVALPVMRELCSRTGETVHLTIRDGDEGVFVQKVESIEPMRWHTEIGRRAPLHAGASMKVHLAFVSREERRAILKRTGLRPIASGTITDLARLQDELAEIRSRGWATSRDELNDGAAGIAAPVFGHDRRVVAGLAITGPRDRMAPRTADLAPLVVDAAMRISQALGFKEAADTAGR